MVSKLGHMVSKLGQPNAPAALFHIFHRRNRVTIENDCAGVPGGFASEALPFFTVRRMPPGLSACSYAISGPQRSLWPVGSLARGNEEHRGSSTKVTNLERCQGNDYCKDYWPRVGTARNSRAGANDQNGKDYRDENKDLATQPEQRSKK